MAFSKKFFGALALTATGSQTFVLADDATVADVDIPTLNTGRPTTATAAAESEPTEFVPEVRAVSADEEPASSDSESKKRGLAEAEENDEPQKKKQRGLAGLKPKENDPLHGLLGDMGGLGGLGNLFGPDGHKHIKDTMDKLHQDPHMKEIMNSLGPMFGGGKDGKGKFDFSKIFGGEDGKGGMDFSKILGDEDGKGGLDFSKILGGEDGKGLDLENLFGGKGKDGKHPFDDLFGNLGDLFGDHDLDGDHADAKHGDDF